MNLKAKPQIAAFIAIVFSLVSAWASPTLTEKLNHHFLRYEDARAFLQKRVAAGTFPVERTEWEAKLKSDSAFGLNEKDIMALKERQKTDIQAARNKAVATSSIHLDDFRNQAEVVQKFCAEIPKGGLLHSHPTGGVKSELISELLTEKNPTVSGKPFNSLSEAEKKAYVAKYSLESPSDFGRFSQIFSDLKPVIGTLHLTSDDSPRNKLAFRVYKHILLNAKKQGATYVEMLRYYDVEQLESLEKMAKQLEAETGVKVRWQIPHLRHLGNDFFKSESARWIRYLGDKKVPTPYVVGINAVGDERDGGAAIQALQPWITPIAMAKREKRLPANFSISIHAGEFGDEANVRDVILMGADRIGHGVKLRSDLVTLEFARKNKIPVEACLVSNHMLKAVDPSKPHPFLDFLRLGLPVSLSTDDDGVLNTDMNKECERAIQTTDIQFSEVSQLYLNSITTSFADEATKTTLLRDLNSKLNDFARAWKTPEPKPRTGGPPNDKSGTNGLTDR